MGKLVDKLQQIGQGGGGGIGFLGRTRGQAPRPAAIVVTLRAADSAAAEAAIKNGADAIIITGWKPSTDLSALKSTLSASSALWGVESAAEGSAAASAITAAQEAGAGFVIVGPTAPATLLADKHEKFDIGVAVDPPADDLGLVLLRAENLLPVQVALLRTRFANADLSQLTVAEFARQRLMLEGLRFPTLVSLREAPEAGYVKLLVRMGADGLVLPGEGVDAAKLGAQVQALREELEKVPAEPDSGSSVVGISGLMEGGGASITRQPPRREPEPEPEPEEE